MESFNDLDLNIDNYNLEKILSLFNLNLLYNEDDLKKEVDHIKPSSELLFE